jgi:hypothetical protein
MTYQEIKEEIRVLEQTKANCEAFIRGYQEALRQLELKIEAHKKEIEQA